MSITCEACVNYAYSQLSVSVIIAIDVSLEPEVIVRKPIGLALKSVNSSLGTPLLQK